jgi:hypothetical protein
MKQASFTNSAAPFWSQHPAFPPAANTQLNGLQRQTAASSTSSTDQSSSPTAQQWVPGTYTPPHSNHWGTPQHSINDAAMAPPPPPPPSGPVFNTIHGNYNKFDQSVHSTNIRSGNTHGVLIQDSYNDNSVKSYAPEPGQFTLVVD